MREILFRGKQVGDGEWIEGYVFPQVIDGGYVPLCITTEPICANDYSEILGDWAIVDSSTVGQYTGLTDRNGKKIFEGDVLNVHDQIPTFDGYNTDEIIYNGKVMYIKNQGMYVCEGNNDGNALCALNLDKCEVIGNIHDNPELLGGESDG